MPLLSGTGAIRIVAGALLASDGNSSNIISVLSPGTSVSSASILDSPKILMNTDVSGAVSTTTTSNDSIPQILGASTAVAPVIWDYPVAPKVGERLIIKGTAPPDARVFIMLSHQGGNEVIADVLSGSEGMFTYASDERLQRGSYVVWAEAEAQDGTRGERSKEVSFAVLSDQFATTIMGFDTSKTIDLALIMLALILFLAGIAFLNRRFERH